MKYRGTKEPFGFCIPGMWIYDMKSEKVLKFDKHYGRSLNAETVKHGKVINLIFSLSFRHVNNSCNFFHI